MSRTVKKKSHVHRRFYNLQNRKVHAARAQLGMDLDVCRELARQINGKPSISSLTLRQRWRLIEMLKKKGARVYNPSLSRAIETEPIDSVDREEQERFEDVFSAHLDYWNKRFPNKRAGFASNRQLAWIKTLFELDFDDGRAGSAGLRGFIFRQTSNLKEGPVSDLSFLRSHQVDAVLTPLREKARKAQGR